MLAYYNRSDITEAYYIFFRDRACSYARKVKTQLKRLSFKPRSSLRDRYDLNDNAWEIYRALRRKHRKNENNKVKDIGDDSNSGGFFRSFRALGIGKNCRCTSNNNKRVWTHVCR